MIRKLYDWVFALARHRHAPAWLGGVSFVESSFFPIPPDVLLIPMVLGQRQRWLLYATICTVASVLGAFLGYFIGAFLMDAVGMPLLALYGAEDSFEKVRHWYNEWGGWGVFFAAVTPFPYKVLTIFSGATGLNLIVFGVVSIVGRGLRFYAVSWLLYLYGEPVRLFIEKRLGLIFTIGVALLVGGFAAVKLLL